jgi:hypothetical protein
MLNASEGPTRVQWTAAYLASAATWSIAEHTLAGQDFGNWIFVEENDMLAPPLEECNITNDHAACYRQIGVLEKSLGQYSRRRRRRFSFSYVLAPNGS